MRYQYDSLVEPLSTSAETITIDKWHYDLSMPFVKAALRVALVSSLSFVEFSVPVQADLSTDWIIPTSQPSRPQPSAIAGGGVLVEFSVPVQADLSTDWISPTSQPSRPPPSAIAGGGVLVEFSVPVQVAPAVIIPDDVGGGAPTNRMARNTKKAKNNRQIIQDDQDLIDMLVKVMPELLKNAESN